MGLLLDWVGKKREACNGKTSDAADWLESGMGLAGRMNDGNSTRTFFFFVQSAAVGEDDSIIFRG
jgi:hypothetical protein